jgi:hypothetical protein
VYESAIPEVPATGPSGPVTMPGALERASSMTVFSGDLYVAERLEGDGIAGSASRTDQFAPSGSKPGEYGFASQLPLQPEPGNGRYAGIAFGATTGEAEMYIGQRNSPSGVDAFSAGMCGDLECASLQKLWTGAEAPHPLSHLADITVDHSSGSGTSAGDWASGDVFAAEEFDAPAEEPVIDIFKPEAGGGEKYVGQVTGRSASESFKELKGIAVSGFNGDLVVGAPLGGSNAAAYLFRPEKGKYVFVQELLPPSGSLKEVQAVAVDDGNGEIYVATTTAVYEFGPEGSFRGDITSVPKEGIPTGIKGQSEEVRFNEDTARPVSLAVDPESHRVFVGVFGSQVGPKGESLAAVDVFGPDVVVPDVETRSPFNLELETDGSGAHSWGILATGTVNPDNAGEASCWFVWGTSKQALNRVTPCEEEAVPSVGTPVPVDASLSGLQPDTTYYYRLQARNEHGTNLGEESQDYEFTTPGPGLESESVSSVSSSSAKLEATIAPHDASNKEHDLQGGTNLPTMYYFQYSKEPTEGCVAAPSACVNVPLAPASTGTSVASVGVEEDLSKLTPSTTYHYRVLAMNEALPKVVPGVIPTAEPGVQIAFYGPDRTFTTQGPGKPSAPPDGRVWELVSPVDKHGAKIIEGWAQTAVAGDEFTFLTGTPSTSSASGYDGNGNQVLSSRVAPGVWSSVDISLSHSQPTGVFADVLPEYRFFSEDLGLGIAESLGPFSVPEGWHENHGGAWERVVEASPLPTERTPYLRHDTTCESNRPACYEPLLFEEDTAGGEAYGGDPTADEGDVRVRGATPDATHAVISSNVRLTETPVTGKAPWLYEWSANRPAAQRLSLVSVPSATEILGGERFEGISTDGSLVFFANRGPIQRELQVRDVPRGETVRLDVPESGVPAKTELSFWGASADGSKAFFTDHAQLRKGAGTTGADLYVCDVGAAPLNCVLTDLTPVPGAGRPGALENARVSRVLGISADGSYVYFLAEGVQAQGATPGEENLYVAHEREGAWSTSFIASPGSGVDVASAVSSSGRWLAFSSQASLTGYDNRDAKTGLPDSEVYLYDAQSEKVGCASCDPTGARPVGPAGVSGPGRPHAEGENTFVLTVNAGATRSLFDNGRLFFDSGDALVPQDTNGNVDVYEFEPAGVGDCSSSSPTFAARTGGCVGLISSGLAFGPSVFLEASATGGDVFFTTAERLVPEDVDTAVDVYDAHECTAASPCASRTQQIEECGSAASCRAAPLPQPSLYGAPSSSTFSGAGNVTPGTPGKPKPTVEEVRREKLRQALRACRKRRSRGRRVGCERKARARYTVKSSKSSVRRSAVTVRRGTRG